MIKKEPPIYYEQYQGWKHCSRLPGPKYRWWQLFFWLTSVSSNFSGPQFLAYRIVMRIQWAEEYRVHTPPGIHTNAIIIYTNIIHQCYYSSRRMRKEFFPLVSPPPLSSCVAVATGLICSLQHLHCSQGSPSADLSNDIPLIKRLDTPE